LPDVGVTIVTGNTFHHRERPPPIEFSEKDRHDAARLLALIAGEGRSSAAGFQHPVSLARAILEDRRRRALIFNPAMFGEPAWELLLTLYMNDADGPRLTIGRLAKLAGCTLTTTLRWLDYLSDQQLIIREEHPGDARTKYIRLTDKARDALELYLTDMATPRF
jgi:DNA-binding MarR family transcriptional regulator